MKVVLPSFSYLTEKIYCISFGSCMKCFPGWARFFFFFAGCWTGGICRKPVQYLKWLIHAWRKSGLDTLILCLGDVLHLFEIQRAKSEGTREILFPR